VTYPYECCGILIGRSKGFKKVEEILETGNMALRGGRARYRLDGRDFVEATHMSRQKGLDIIGFYHSHPAGTSVPSAKDRELAWQGYSYLIISLQVGEEPTFRSWILAPSTNDFIEERLELCPRGAGQWL
jgi:proteasome lid subunit RPN8/RPN11